MKLLLSAEARVAWIYLLFYSKFIDRYEKRILTEMVLSRDRERRSPLSVERKSRGSAITKESEPKERDPERSLEKGTSAEVPKELQRGFQVGGDNANKATVAGVSR